MLPPSSMVCRPSMERSSVDLPDPEGPIRAIISPRETSSDTPSRARRLPKVLATPRIERTASLVMRGRVLTHLSGLDGRLFPNFYDPRTKLAVQTRQTLEGPRTNRRFTWGGIAPIS